MFDDYDSYLRSLGETDREREERLNKEDAAEFREEMKRQNWDD